ncbi:hypothetical protein K439DRAFT_1625540 [Ramaria rubella]|nr:hypothetical protein K439DRAFT_1625540 [Ramaria rubella]
MAVDPTKDEEDGSEYIPDGRVLTLDGTHSQTLDVNASEEDDLRADDYQDDRVDDDEKGDKLRSADDGGGSVTDLVTRGLACIGGPHVSPAASCKILLHKDGRPRRAHEQEPNPVAGCPGGYGSVDVFSQRTVAWELRPDAHASATQGVVKLDRVTANRSPGAPGKDEVLWELMYFFNNMDNPTGAPRKETGDPRFTRQHLVVTFMDLILFAHGMAAPRARLPLRGYEALAPSLTVPCPAQFFQGIAEQGYVWQNMPYGIDFTGDIGVYGRSGTFRSWGKAQRGAWFAVLCHDDPDQRLGLVCMHTGEYQSQQNLPMLADGNTRGAMASLHDPTRARRASGADARISSVLPVCLREPG